MRCHEDPWPWSLGLVVASKSPIEHVTLVRQVFTESDKFIIPCKLFQGHEGTLHTSGGNIFSAARRGTENPPWVLVSLAVSVLQKNSTGCLFCFRPSSDASIASRSYWSCMRRCYFFTSRKKVYIARKPQRPVTYFANRLKRHLSINFISFRICLRKKSIFSNHQ
jgi:hypothetical protein